MRISDWSSDVCSSDLRCRHWPRPGARPTAAGAGRGRRARTPQRSCVAAFEHAPRQRDELPAVGVLAHGEHALRAESEPEPRVVAVAEPLAVLEPVAALFHGSGSVIVLVHLPAPRKGRLRHWVEPLYRKKVV